MENLGTQYINDPSRGLVTDLDASLVSKEFWTYSRNCNINTQQGNLNILTNEPSNQLCVNLPYTCIGFSKLIGGQYALFLTDDVNSEIGIFDTNYCSYTTVVNSKCLNFNTSNLVIATSKENFDCSQSIYWTDGLNPMRYLNLSNIPYTFTEANDACSTKKYTNELDCTQILVSPMVTVPTITLSLGSGGELQNGTYQIALAYTINEQRVSDYYGTTVPQPVWSHFNLGQSININITNVDQNFKQFMLVVLYTINNTTTAKIMGYYSISTTFVELVDINRTTYISLPIQELTTLRPKYERADNLVNNDQYLLWSGVATRPDLNYQQQAMNIVPNWILYQVSSNYYNLGGNLVGYSRGERYAFGIQWLFDTGEWSSAFHIPGRPSTPNDLAQAVGADVYEVLSSQNPTPIQVYQVYDTSTVTNITPNSDGLNGVVVAQGEMGYWQSTNTYTDNLFQFGANACLPIRHPQLPRECNAPRYAEGGQFMNILGVQFSNIEHPKDENGNYISEIVGYRIVRSSREGNKSIIASGLFSNVRSYVETLDQGGTGQQVLYPNYPYNDLREDHFISSTQTNYSSGENNFNALSTYEQDKFNFFSPNTLFTNVALGQEILFETEEIASVLGYFENVYLHPRAKILSNSLFWLAIAVGAIDGVLSVFGKKCVYGLKDGTVNISQVLPVVSEVEITALGMSVLQTCEGLVNGLSFTQLLDLNAAEAIAKAALKILQVAASAGMAVYYSFNTANNIIQDAMSFMPYEKYALQYDSHGFFNSNNCIKPDNQRREITYYQYLYNGINSLPGNLLFNNFKRESSVYVQLNSTIIDPSDKDNSRQTLSDANICGNPYNSFNSKASMFYGMVRQKIPDQYGEIDSVVYQDTGYLDTTLTNTAAIGSSNKYYSTGPVFGGDTWIGRFSVNRKHEFFTQNIANANFPDGTEYDYSQYRNVGYPRFWLNTEHYDVSEVIVVGSTPGRLPTNKYNLDCYSSPGGLKVLNLTNTGGFFYLFNSGVLDFFTQSEYNVAFRDWTGDFQNFYSQSQTDLTQIFRSDRIDIPEQFLYDKSFSKQLIENFIAAQRIDYNPTIDETCFSYYKNRVVYSQPASFDLKDDNWLVYLTDNYYDFPLSEFGAITGMHAIDNQQIMFLFDKSAPYISIGRDELQTTSGVKITIGDAGLFEREPRPLIYTDYWYGNSQSRFAFINTQFGSFYPSQRQGRIFNWKGQFDEVSRQGMHFWFKQYMPSFLLQQFPNYNNYDNPVIGVGLTSGWDNTNETYYLSKRDYKLLDPYAGIIAYDSTKNQFSLQGTTIQLGDPNYFENASWTISYSPKDQAFISWHDWQPDWMLQGEDHFYTIKDSAIWTHNNRCDSFCNFYDVDYPWEIEYLINNQGQNEILRNIEYILESGIYFGDCTYFHQILDDNFDQLVAYNLEQSTGYLTPVLRKRNNILDVLNYPNLTAEGWQIAYDKVEQKTRINQLFDLTFDRGEYTKNSYPLWTISPNGYVRTVTPAAINLNKNIFERKKLRNLWHKIYLSKSVSGNHKLLFKFGLSNNTISPR